MVCIACGLWLALSPFILFSQNTLSQAEMTNETGTLLIFGLLALAVAGFSYKRHDALQAGLGVSLGTALLMSPWLFGFAENAVAAWNAGLVGLVVYVTAVYVCWHQKRRNIW